MFPGIFEEPVFTTHHLLQTLVPPLNSRHGVEFLRLACALAGAVLVISNTIAKRAGIPRGVIPKSKSADRVLVPERPRLKYLKAAVTFTEQEINVALRPIGADHRTLSPLILEQGSPSLDDIDPNNGPLIEKPIVRCATNYIAALPSALLPALRHALLRLAADYGELRNTSAAYHRAVLANSRRSLQILGLRDLTIQTQPHDDSFYTEIGLIADTDKQIQVALFTDPLCAYDPTDPIRNLEHPTSTLRISQERFDSHTRGSSAKDLPPTRFCTSYYCRASDVLTPQAMKVSSGRHNPRSF